MSASHHWRSSIFDKDASLANIVPPQFSLAELLAQQYGQLTREVGVGIREFHLAANLPPLVSSCQATVLQESLFGSKEESFKPLPPLKQYENLAAAVMTAFLCCARAVLAADPDGTPRMGEPFIFLGHAPMVPLGGESFLAVNIWPATEKLQPIGLHVPFRSSRSMRRFARSWL